MKTLLRNFLRIIAACCCLLVLGGGWWLIENYDHIYKLVTVVRAVENDYLYEIDREQLTDWAIKGMMANLGDAYAAYIDEEQFGVFQQSISGDVYGIGVYVNQDAEGNIVIIAPIEDGPAEAAGILAGDILKAVDGVRVEGLDLDTVVAKMRAGSDTEASITVWRDGEEYTYVIKRYLVAKTKTVFGEMLTENENIAYLRITSFSAQTSQELVETINELRTAHTINGVVLDLRNNSGGEVGSAIDIARLFVESGPVLHVVYNDEKQITYSATEAQIHVPLAVLVNEHSASASEILAGALKESGAGKLVGTKTFGKGVVQGVYFLHDGTAVKFTQAKYLTPNKNDIHGIGISPDIYVELPENIELNSGEDLQLQKALEVVQR